MHPDIERTMRLGYPSIEYLEWEEEMEEEEDEQT